MTLAQDFEDFVKLLNKHQVDYMVVGDTHWHFMANQDIQVI